MRSVSWILLLVCLFSLVASAGEIQESQVESLIKQLQDEDVRSNAVEALGQIRSKDAVPALIQALQDQDPEVHVRAASALVQIGTPKTLKALKTAVPDLIQALQDRDKGVRADAASVLGMIGEGAKDAVPALIQALRDEDVRSNAKYALGII